MKKGMPWSDEAVRRVRAAVMMEKWFGTLGVVMDAAGREGGADVGVGNDKARRMQEIIDEISACTACPLHAERTNVVPGEGSLDARVMFVGEGPGRDEDLQGRPFVGRAGQLLTRLLSFIGWRREDVYIANVVKCRPPGNRTPTPMEMAACMPFLRRQIEIVRPRIICALGATAMTGLSGGARVSITAVRGKVQQVGDYKVLPTFHPAYLLRNRNAVAVAKEDFYKLKQLAEQC